MKLINNEESINPVNSWNVLPTWKKVLQNTINLKSHYKVVPTEGFIAWEYNPLRNYRLSENMYEKDGKFYTEEEFLAIIENREDYDAQAKKFFKFDENGNKVHIDDFPDGWILRESGELVDFVATELSFNLQHPVEILPLYSYDGSVNLILNDGLNIPRLINSRFTVTGRNTYKVIDRKGDNDTNIYDLGEQFDIDSSLFKNVNKIPKLEYLGTISGNMKIGNYHFYFKYADSDGNESDWVAESGLVSVFIGTSPQSINTGIRDENSIKSVRFKLSNIDIGYSYVKVYYTRYSADVDSNLVVDAKRIDKNFIVNSSGVCMVLITGDENETEVTLEEINSSFDVIQNAQTQCTAANRLFMANIHKSRVEYDLLAKLSLCFCPYKHLESYPLSDNGIDEQYMISSKSDGYYDSLYIYDKTGYWPGELYRLGIVYILKDGSLSPVFNIRGATDITDATKYKIDDDFNSDGTNLEEILSKIEYSEEDFMIVGGKANNENAKGVIQLNSKVNPNDPFPIFGIKLKTENIVIEELKKYVKGFFFVRLKRIPLTLAQGIVIGLDKESRTPTLPTLGGVLLDINYDKTFIETRDINDINFISEGFLGHYKFTLEKKEQSLGMKFLIAVAAIAVVAAAVVACVFTCGAAAAALAVVGVAVAGSITAGMTTALIVTGAVAAAGIVATAVTYSGMAIDLAVRQKLNKAEALAIKGRNEEIPEGYERKELDESRKLLLDIASRYVIKDPTKNTPEALIVPDYLVNHPYYNLFLTGEKFTVNLTYELPITNYLNEGFFDSIDRHFYVPGYNTQSDNKSYNVKLVGVPDGCPIRMIGESKYCARAGYPEEAYKYEFLGVVYEDAVNLKDNSDIIRGNFGSFVGMLGYLGHTADLVNIMIPGYVANNLFQYVLLRALDNSAFYAISDRIDINENKNKFTSLQLSEKTEFPFEEVFYRGDCYICQYTHRIIRNFNDPSAPYNDKIVDPNTWKDNYDPDKPEEYFNINLGDVNAVLLGLWLTFLLRSSYNLNIRTIDKSNIDEYLMCGNYRSFYPNYGLLAAGCQKIPDSNQYNKGFSKSVSEKYYFEVPDVPYIKLEFLNRIVFSDIHINDAYKNGFRVLRTTNHKDYPMTYGSITKIIELKNNLLLVFEHGVGLVAINNAAEHPSKVLSDITPISDTYGSLWKDSIIKTPSGVYGIDTVAKKIWRVKNEKMEIISDFKVQEFLNQNISLSERELTPILGIRNVKTVYNAFKHDIMFTFYDNLYGVHEKAWNLCWNELLELFTTFYSWIPSEMANIDNIPFSFDRNVVKAISKLGVSNHDNDFSDGVTLSNNILLVGKNDDGTYKFDVSNKEPDMTYIDKQGLVLKYEFNKNELTAIVESSGFIGFLYIDNRQLLDGKTKYIIKYELLRDLWKNNELFEIKTASITVKEIKELLQKEGESTKAVLVSYLSLKEGVNVESLLSELYYRNKAYHAYADIDTNRVEPLTKGDTKIPLIDMPIFKNKIGKRLMLPKELLINPDKIVRYLNIKATLLIGADPSSLDARESYYGLFTESDTFESQVALTTDFNISLLSTDFWKHGLAGLIDICDKIFPTYWYGLQHPFEFECVVVDDPSVHKIFTNLEIVANKTKPESFHYEVVGDVYDFSEDKPTMYFRQEALKALYLYNGYDIEYNSNFLEIEPKQHNRSADFPKYYSRWDTINEIYDSYKRFSAPLGFNYDHLAGAEIVYYPTRNEFRVWNHAEAIDVDSLSSELATSVIKANCRYLEDKWLVSINPIIVTYKNEFDKTKAANEGKSMFSKDAYGIYEYSTWADSFNGETKLPLINIQGTKLEDKLGNVNIEFPGEPTKAVWDTLTDTEKENYSVSEDGKDNALYKLYDLTMWRLGDWRPIDPYKNKDRRETDVRGKFMKVRIRYSGEELAIIDFLNTIYQISYA